MIESEARPAPPAPPTPPATAPNLFRDALAASPPARPLYAVELVPAPERLGPLFRFAEGLRDAGVSVVLTDGAGGSAAPPPDPVAAEVAQIIGRQPVVTVACKTASRAELMARLDALHDRGLRNLLVVTGDYPRDATGAFPLDSVQLLLAATGRDSTLAAASPSRQDGGPDDRCLGAVVSPFKYSEAEMWGQRVKAWKKWRAGASFLATQIGFDVRKFQELRRWMALDGMADLPVLATVYPLHARSARLLAGGRLPGVYLPPDLEAFAATLTGPAGRAVARRRAALLADVLVRGLGYRGVLFCGLESPRDLTQIMETVAALAGQDWQSSLREYLRPGASDGGAPVSPVALRCAPDGGFYLFPEDEGGLLRDGPPRTGDRAAYARAPAALAGVHRLLFEPGQPGAFVTARALAAGDKIGLLPALTALERVIKAPLLGCQMCGDCRMAMLQYRCPEPARGCGKGLLNGPCAGATVDGRCEVYPGRTCYWRVVLESALAGSGGDGADGVVGQLGPLYEAQLPRDPALRGTSSWRNFFAGRTPPPLSLGPPPAGALERPEAPPRQAATPGAAPVPARRVPGG